MTTGNFSNLVSEVLLTENSSGNFSNLVSETLVETVYNLSYKTVIDNNKRANSFIKFTSINEQPTFIPIALSSLGWMLQQGEPHYNRPHVQKNEFSQTVQITYYHRCPPILRNQL